MNPTDIRRIREAGLISAEQETAIVAHFRLDHGTNRFLAIVGIIGALLVSAGISLLVASNWEAIPRLPKVGIGVFLLLLSHGLGAWLSRSDRHPVLAEACHLMGSGMFLANIALIGQAYHLSSRPPNAIALWLASIIPLAWILRSRTQHILSLVVFGLWFGLEMNTEGGWIYFWPIERQTSVYILFGVLFAGIGPLLRRTSYPTFGPPTEKFGLLAIHIASFPLSLGIFYEGRATSLEGSHVAMLLAVVCTLLWLVAVPLLAPDPNRQWTWVWSGAMLVVIGLAWSGIIVNRPNSDWDSVRFSGPHWFCIPVLFIFCLLQAQYGLLRRSPWMVNVAIIFVGIHIITAYIQLFGSMQTTGMMFVVSGLLLVGLTFYLERSRRKLMKRMCEPSGSTLDEATPPATP